MRKLYEILLHWLGVFLLYFRQQNVANYDYLFLDYNHSYCYYEY